MRVHQQRDILGMSSISFHLLAEARGHGIAWLRVARFTIHANWTHSLGCTFIGLSLLHALLVEPTADQALARLYFTCAHLANVDPASGRWEDLFLPGSARSLSSVLLLLLLFLLLHLLFGRLFCHRSFNLSWLNANTPLLLSVKLSQVKRLHFRKRKKSQILIAWYYYSRLWSVNLTNDCLIKATENEIVKNLRIKIAW